MIKRPMTPWLLGLLAAGILYSCSTNPVTGKKQIIFMSEEREIALGKASDPQIVAQYGLYEDPGLQQFINEKGKQMAAISHRPHLNYEFKIIDSDILNAFAVPGGYIYFSRGIMAHFNNEAEFAGVLGHEIGHVTARHSASQQSRQTIGQIGLIAGMILSPQIASMAEEAAQGLQLLFLSHSREAEMESDGLGVEYSTKIGYDAHQMAGFFNTLKREQVKNGLDNLPPFLSTHPDPGDRNVRVAQLATQWQQQLPLRNPVINRNEYLKRVDGIIYGQDPKQGFLEQGVFYHPVLRLQFPVPAQWRFENAPDKVQLMQPQGQALLMLKLVQANSLREAAQGIIQQNNLQVQNSQERSVNGIPSLQFIATTGSQQQQQQQQPIQMLVYLYQYNNLIYMMAGMSSPQQFSNYSNQFANTMEAFRPLTDQAKLNKQPERVRIRTVGQTANLQQQLARLGMPSNRMEELAILNGMNLSDNVPVGTIIKIIQ